MMPSLGPSEHSSAKSGAAGAFSGRYTGPPYQHLDVNNLIDTSDEIMTPLIAEELQRCRE